MLAAALALSAPALADSLDPSCKRGDGSCLAKVEAEAQRCAEVKNLRVGVATVSWHRCGPANESWSADGELERPRNYLVVRMPGGGTAYVLGPDKNDPGADLSDSVLVDVEPVAGQWLFINALESGTGHFNNWALLDLGSAPLFEATLPPDFESRSQSLLRKHEGETFCCRGWQVEVEDKKLVMTTWIRYLNDAQATSHAEVKATLALRGRSLVLQHLRRRPLPSSD